LNNIPFYDQVIAQLRWQAQKIAEFDTELKQLKKELSEVQAQRQIHVDKIEYKFDQLKIETLEGTLNIGISPNGGKQIEEMMVEDKEFELSDPEKDQRYQAVKDQVDHYLSSGCISDLKQLEANYQVILGQAYREAIIKDMRNQVDKRIEVYLDNMAHIHKNGSENEVVFEKVKRDIQTAMERHLKSKKQGGSLNENGG
jgi:spore germination protein PC